MQRTMSEGTIKLQTKFGFYETTSHRVDMALLTFAGTSVSELRELLAERTECDYADTCMSELLIIAAACQLA